MKLVDIWQPLLIGGKDSRTVNSSAPAHIIVKFVAKWLSARDEREE